jgi:hypothetical protein
MYTYNTQVDTSQLISERSAGVKVVIDAGFGGGKGLKIGIGCCPCLLPEAYKSLRHRRTEQHLIETDDV